MVSQGADNSALAAAKARIAELETEIVRLSARDSLVASLLTLPALRAQLELDVQRAHRYSRPLAVAILDIDHFRRLNVARGYTAGDLVLAAVGRLLAAGTRAHDLVARAGGDELSSCFPKPSSTRRSACSSGRPRPGAARGGGPGGDSGLRRPRGAAIGRERGRRARPRPACPGGGPRRGRRPDPGQQADRARGPYGGRGGHRHDRGDRGARPGAEERDNYTGEHSDSVVDLMAASPRRWASRRTRSRRSAARRCCTTSARSGSPTRSSTRPARSTRRSGRSCASTR